MVAVNIPGKVKLGTVGPLVPETELRVVDDSGIDVPQGQRGELLIKGPQVMLGYWDKKEANLEAFSEDGWLKTGDYVEVVQLYFLPYRELTINSEIVVASYSQSNCYG